MNLTNDMINTYKALVQIAADRAEDCYEVSDLDGHAGIIKALARRGYLKKVNTFWDDDKGLTHRNYACWVRVFVIVKKSDVDELR